MSKFIGVGWIYAMVFCLLSTAAVPVNAAQTGGSPSTGQNSATQTVKAPSSSGQTAQSGGLVSIFKDVNVKDSNLLFINYLAKRDLMKGFPDKSFHPLNKVTRAEAAVLLVRAAGLKTAPAKVRFSDVGPKYWAAGSINTAVAAGYLRGYPGGKFRPNQVLTELRA